MEEEDSDEEEDYIYEDYIYEDYIYEDYISSMIYLYHSSKVVDRIVEFSFMYLCLGPFVNGSAVSAFAHYRDTFRVQATLLRCVVTARVRVDQ